MEIAKIVNSFISESDKIIREELNKMLAQAGVDTRGKTTQQIEQELKLKEIILSSIHHRKDGIDIVSYHLQKDGIRYSLQFQLFYRGGSLKLIEIAREGYE